MNDLCSLVQRNSVHVFLNASPIPGSFSTKVTYSPLYWNLNWAVVTPVSMF